MNESQAIAGPVDADAPALTRYEPPSAAWRWLIRLMFLSAMAVNAMLLMQSLAGSSLPGCGPGSAFDCDSVLASRWSRWLGVPVSVLAIVAYAALLGLVQLALHARRLATRRRAWRGLMVGCACVMLAALWFVTLQKYMGQFCLYCMVAHGLGSLASLLLMLLAPLGPQRVTPDEPADALMIPLPTLVKLASLALIPMAILLAGQWLVAPRTHITRQAIGGVADFDTGPQAGNERSMSVLTGKIRLKPADFPLIGQVTDERVILHLYDYTCPNCRAMHGSLHDALAKFKGRLAVVKLPVPLDSRCNPYVEKTSAMHQGACDLAKLALAVWKADASQFAQFDDWLMQGDQPPGLERARAKAGELVGIASLEQALADPDIDRRIAATMTLYDIIGRGTIPQMILGSQLVIGRPDPEQLMELFEKQFRPPAQTQPADAAAASQAR